MQFIMASHTLFLRSRSGPCIRRQRILMHSDAQAYAP